MATDNKGTLGLCITPTTITAAQAHLAGGKVEITVLGVAETPRRAMEGGAILDAPRLAHAIRELMRQLGIKAKTACVALSAGSDSLRVLRLPDVPIKERRTLVRFELEDAGAIMIGAGAFDFLWVPSPSEQGKNHAEVYAYYATDGTVDTIRETLRLAGLRLETIEPASLATIRAYLTLLTRPQPVALLYPYGKHSDLFIHDGIQVRSVRRIPFGWSELFEPPTPSAEALPRPESPQAPWDTANSRTLKGLNLGEDAPDQEPAPPILSGTGAAPIPLASVEFLSSEIARSLAFYAREHPDAPRAQSLVILGPQSAAQELQTLLTPTLPLPIAISDPKRDFPGNPRVENQAELCALGVALGADAGYVPALDISLQEAASRTRRRAPVVLFAGMAGSTLWMVLSIIASVVLTLLQSQLRTESAHLTSDIKAIQDVRAPLLKRQEIETAVKATKEHTQVPAPEVLGRVAASQTPGIALSIIQVASTGRVSVEGRAATPEAMQQFASLLGQGKTIRFPAFDSMKKDSKEGLTFRIGSVFRTDLSADKK